MKTKFTDRERDLMRMIRLMAQELIDMTAQRDAALAREQVHIDRRNAARARRKKPARVEGVCGA